MKANTNPDTSPLRRASAPNPASLAEVRELVRASFWYAADAFRYGGQRENAAAELEALAEELALAGPDIARENPDAGLALAAISRAAFDARDAMRDRKLSGDGCQAALDAMRALFSRLS